MHVQAFCTSALYRALVPCDSTALLFVLSVSVYHIVVGMVWYTSTSGSSYSELIKYAFTCVRRRGCVGIGTPGNILITFRADGKCIVDRHARVCVSVCMSVRGRMPTLLHGPRYNLGSGRGCP